MIDRLEYNFSDLPSYEPSVAQMHARLGTFIERLELDALVVTSQDEFISEYVPRRNSQRFALSGFDGSAGSGIFLSEAAAARIGVPRFVLFVDGRYHLQAESQCDKAHVHLQKLELGLPIWSALAMWLSTHAGVLRSVGYDALRVSVAQRDRLFADTRHGALRWTGLTSREIDRAIDLPGWQVDRPIFELPESMTGTAVAGNIAALNDRLRGHLGNAGARVCWMTCAADDIGYLLNSRGYHMPNASSHLGYLFVVGDQVALYLPEGCERCPVQLEAYPKLQVFRNDLAALGRFLALFDVDHVCYGAESVNCAMPDALGRVWPHARHSNFSPVESMRVSKTPQVLAQFRDAFARSSAAIAQTMRWAKYGEAGQRHSEYDLARKINDAYAARGAVGLSFTTIAAHGANSALAHYAAASKDIALDDGELLLLDSGAYYEGGFATDCTRVVLRKTDAGTQAQPWQREIYTTTLKACIKGLITPFRADLTGEEVDEAVRDVCRARGYDFNHGTGHGIGIHVHEGGVRFAPGSKYGLVPNAVISVEPGIYVAGKGGVRIENIVVIHPSASDQGKVEFENLVAVGYDWDLIDIDMLDDDERRYLREYEQLCAELGNSVTACPLLQSGSPVAHSHSPLAQ
ncbi:M24 family metallopeptidase [Trinickia dinghuensis]|uniref:M24 family metallopeptidase n=1 Tax=Trinickia dinghuensis TaxID=2291023 RepID=A0A3D8K0U0_9BURK|nr:M24 family metallopeptidase [Trinickia dinghuensis]RDU98702.1 M24 family metallopeptidase [Trinickia dinghuensis]